MEGEQDQPVWLEQRPRGLPLGRPLSAHRPAAEWATWFPQA